MKNRICLALLLLTFPAQASVVLTFFSPSAYNSNVAVMDATLGISGFSVDTFESTALIAGLTIQLSGNGVPATTLSSLANLFDQSLCGSLSDNSAWDGTHGAINVLSNLPSNCSTPTGIASLTTFQYAPGAASFGVGFGNFQSLSSPQFPVTNHELFVNGLDLGVLETLAGPNFVPGLARNGYLRVDGNGTPITSVGIQNISGADILVFDHVAIAGISSVPEPVSASLCAAALLILAGACVRRNIAAERKASLI